MASVQYHNYTQVIRRLINGITMMHIQRLGSWMAWAKMASPIQLSLPVSQYYLNTVHSVITNNSHGSSRIPRRLATLRSYIQLARYFSGISFQDKSVKVCVPSGFQGPCTACLLPVCLQLNSYCKLLWFCESSGTCSVL